MSSSVLTFRGSCDNEDIEAKTLSVSSEVFFSCFPFNIVFNRDLMIVNVGTGLQSVAPHMLGEPVDEMFILNRPLVDFSLANVSIHSSNLISPHFERCVLKNY